MTEYKKTVEFMEVSARVHGERIEVLTDDVRKRRDNNSGVYLSIPQAEAMVEALSIGIAKARRWRPGFYEGES